VKYLDILLALLKLGVRCDRTVLITTQELGRLLNISQQSASRLLCRLEKEGYIQRESSPIGTKVSLTSKAMGELLEAYKILHKTFTGLQYEMILCGKVFTGLGEGKYYVTLPYYYRMWQEKLGFSPYPGTLNIRLEPEYIRLRKILENIPAIEIKGYSNKLRSYGGVKCFKGEIENIECALLLIERTHYGPDVIEIIAPVCLREKLKLKDGDKVKVRVKL